jgi:hypothetical protein
LTGIGLGRCAIRRCWLTTILMARGSYLKQPHAHATAPRVRLADFARVHIGAGASATVSLSFG